MKPLVYVFNQKMIEELKKTMTPLNETENYAVFRAEVVINSPIFKQYDQQCYKFSDKLTF